MPQTLYSHAEVWAELPRDALTQHAVTPIKRVTGLGDVIDRQHVRAAAASSAESRDPVAGRTGALILS